MRSNHASILALVAGLLTASQGFAADSLSAHTGGPAPSGPVTQSGAVPRGSATITQSTANTITPGSISCSASGLHADNSYYRAFTLSAFPALTQAQFVVESVAFGVEIANDGANAGQPLTVNLHRSSANPPTLASLTQIATESVTIPDSATGTLFSVNFTAPPTLIVATDILVVEVVTPNGQPSNHSFFIGSNAAGQTNPSFIRAATCGVAEITNLASIGFPNMHIVMSVSGNTQVPVTLQSFEID